ncbi:hypothetical protein GWI33_012238 [Rhynchophorus ferrugineus]|uniref:Uncharacterized protein n=1 Tax=Rhynchophorus ferrugineus TaxID=354439 RepID=A0A834I959_RHYFE|nr:hypothetical protein GWI33_012238 [Rhynchophorus ferrugineus]
MDYKKVLVTQYHTDITNFFKTSGFEVPCNDESDDEEEFNIQETEFEEFVTFNNDLAVCGERTDADIFTSA